MMSNKNTQNPSPKPEPKPIFPKTHQQNGV